MRVLPRWSQGGAAILCALSRMTGDLTYKDRAKILVNLLAKVKNYP
jgi:hypothetical protein